MKRPMSAKKLAEKLAEKIARQLFTTGSGLHVDALALVDEDDRPTGYQWTERSAAGRILALILESK